MSILNKKSVIVFLSLIFMLPFFAACDFFASDNSDKADINVTVFIKGPEGYILENAAVVVSEGDSVFKALLTACENHDIELQYSGMGGFTYISGIAGFKEFDHGGNSGWIYMVDKEKPNIGVGSKKLADKNIVKFFYSKDLGGDVEWEE